MDQGSRVEISYCPFSHLKPGDPCSILNNVESPKIYQRVSWTCLVSSSSDEGAEKIGKKYMKVV